MRESLREFAQKEDVVVLLKFHPLTAQKYIDEYKQLAEEVENIVWINDFNVTKYMLMSDAMISDTSSTIYEFLLLRSVTMENLYLHTWQVIRHNVAWTEDNFR